MSAHIERTLDALKADLDANLAAKVTSINAEFTDDFDIEAPAAITIATRAELAAYPHVMVLPEESDPEFDSGAYLLWRHRVRVVSWLADPDEEALARKLLRFQRAVRETLLTGRPTGDWGFGLEILRDEYGPVFAPEGEATYLQAASSLFLVRQQQSV